MKKDDEPTRSNSLIPTSGQALARRSDALVVRGIRDLETTERAYAEAELERGIECEGAEKFADAAIHYRNAAELGHAWAQFRLAEMYQGGKGIEQNLHEAQVWFGRIREAAERGESEAQWSLGLMFSDGLGAGQDYAEAAEWWRRAAEQGDAAAAASLAHSYHNGRGVMEDHDEEERWLLEAAAKGNPLACHELGMMHMGLDSTNPAELSPELQRLFANDAAAARRAVCRSRHERDLVKACMWFKLGAMKTGVERGQGLCKMWCELILPKFRELTASQIDEAERLAREWKAAVDNAATRSNATGETI